MKHVSRAAKQSVAQAGQVQSPPNLPGSKPDILGR